MNLFRTGELFDLMSYVKKRNGRSFDIHIYGQGPHEQEIKTAAADAGLPTTFFPAKDHSMLRNYKVFINPSLSEVLCTTIVEVGRSINR